MIIWVINFVLISENGVMGIRSYLKNTVKDNTNVKGWASWESLKKNGKTVASLLNDLKTPDLSQPINKVSFDEAMKRYGLTDKDMQKRMQSHWYVAVVCAVLGVGTLGWTIHLLTKSLFLSSLVSLALAALMLVYAFREHFYYFQMKKRRLDCTVREWIFSFFSR